MPRPITAPQIESDPGGYPKSKLIVGDEALDKIRGMASFPTQLRLVLDSEEGGVQQFNNSLLLGHEPVTTGPNRRR